MSGHLSATAARHGAAGAAVRIVPPTLAASLLFLSLGVGPDAVATESGPVSASTRDVPGRADEPPISVGQVSQLLKRLEEQNARLAEQNAKLMEQNARLAEQNDSLARQLVEGAKGQSAANARERDPLSADAASRTPPSLTTKPVVVAPPAARPSPPKKPIIDADEDDPSGQIVVARRQQGPMPFELRADLFTQIRYSNFARDRDYWIDSAGNLQPLSSFDSFELTRNFIQFSGYALDPRLQFTANIFSSTAINNTVYLGWINYRFNRAFDLRAGNWIVPGTREWLESFRYTLGADRLMATTFFRPNISPGVWAQGEPFDNVHYVAMVANSLNRFNQGVDRIGTSIAVGGTVWWEPMGPFGPGPSDIEHHPRLSPRLGTSFAVSRESNQGFGAIENGNPEDTILRLSDGTPLFRPGALAPGVELSKANVNLWALDAALKYRGFTLSGEYFLRWLDGFDYRGGELPMDSLFDHGALLQTGYFMIPGRLEGFARSSFVSGRFGGGYEVGGGVNWYLRASRDWRMTFEVLNVNRSPAQNLLTGYRAGESGTLYQLQLFTDFF
ncbi:bZIP transcription factor [Methylolobus aquaticus]|nr:bZIP transcription factor [Methylolobus aquaticus]